MPPVTSRLLILPLRLRLTFESPANNNTHNDFSLPLAQPAGCLDAIYRRTQTHDHTRTRAISLSLSFFPSPARSLFFWSFSSSQQRQTESSCSRLAGKRARVRQHEPNKQASDLQPAPALDIVIAISPRLHRPWVSAAHAAEVRELPRRLFAVLAQANFASVQAKPAMASTSRSSPTARGKP